MTTTQRRSPNHSPERIRWAMEQHGHNVNQMARHLGVNRMTVSRWLHEHHPPQRGLAVRALNSYIYGAIRLEQEREKRG
jgi:transposase-like protein